MQLLGYQVINTSKLLAKPTGARHVSSGARSPVVDDGQEAKGEADTEGHGHGVARVGGHALEDLASPDHSTAAGKW